MNDQLAICLNLLQKIFGDSKNSLIWLLAPHPYLRYRPIDYLSNETQIHKLIDVLEGMAEKTIFLS